MSRGGDHWLGLIGLGIFAIFLLIVALIVARMLKQRGGHWLHHQYRDPLDIARERYAKGEITKEQFDDLKNDLKL
jgi:putative membrane protein